MFKKWPYILFCASFFLLAGLLAAIGKNDGLSIKQVVEKTNEARIAAGLQELRVSPLLQAASADKALDMASVGYFSHSSPKGVEPWDWIDKNRYAYLLAGENLAINFSDPEKLLAAWLGSPEHKANILNPAYRDIGVSVQRFQKLGRDYTVVVQFFGTPQALGMR